MNSEELTRIEDNIAAMGVQCVKSTKKFDGLIERVESSKIILVEGDNRQVLMD